MSRPRLWRPFRAADCADMCRPMRGHDITVPSVLHAASWLRLGRGQPVPVSLGSHHGVLPCATDPRGTLATAPWFASRFGAIRGAQCWLAEAAAFAAASPAAFPAAGLANSSSGEAGWCSR